VVFTLVALSKVGLGRVSLDNLSPAKLNTSRSVHHHMGAFSIALFRKSKPVDSQNIELCEGAYVCSLDFFFLAIGPRDRLYLRVLVGKLKVITLTGPVSCDRRLGNHNQLATD